MRIEASISGFGTPKLPSLIDVMAGREGGRASDQEILLFNNNGHEGLQFPGVAARVYQEARRRGLGTEVPSALFLQNEKN